MACASTGFSAPSINGPSCALCANQFIIIPEGYVTSVTGVPSSDPGAQVLAISFGRGVAFHRTMAVNVFPTFPSTCIIT